MKSKIDLPINLLDKDRHYFEKSRTWEYQDPKVASRNFIFVFPKGYCTDIQFTPVRDIAPWEGFYKTFKRTYFIGDFANYFFKRFVNIILRKNFYYCINQFSDNYFHWFTEVLPKMLFIKSKDPNAVFFIPFSLKPYQESSLKMGDLEIAKAESKVSFFRKIKIVENVAIYPGVYHPALVNLVRECFRKATKSPNGSKKNRRIYITRRSADRRRLINEEEILPVLLLHGFEVFDFDHVSFTQQMAITSETDILLSIHGAALTNMIFLPEKSVVVEMLPVVVPNDKCYYILAGTLGLSYFYLNCRLHGQNHITGDFSVDKGELESLLQYLVSQQVAV